jgi:DNA-directed RNA polymerase subunit RPC12/RpoP
VREVHGWPERSHPDKIVYTGELPLTMSRKHKFGKAEFCLPDFEFVNRCAYFDYQRERAYLRIKKNLGATKPRPTSKRPRRAKINKRIEVSLKRCPFCNSRRISEGRPLSTRNIDMKFLESGVKKWVTAYSSCRYHCDKCGKTFSPPGYPQAASLYGEGLVNWTIYQNVALGQNMLKVERCLREVFKLDIPQPTLHRFKVSVRSEPGFGL